MTENGRETENTPACACGNRGSVPGGRIPIDRVRDKLDALEAAGDGAGAVRLLNYWLAEAQSTGDQSGEVLVENEFVGFYRKAGEGAASLAHGAQALELVKTCGLEGTITAGTTRINLATACVAFGQPDQARVLFEEAKTIYEAGLDPEDGRLGGLYNNMGLCMIPLKRFAEGRTLFEKALRVMASVPGGEREAAVTCLNLADLASAEAEEAGDEDTLIHAAEETEKLVNRAWELLNAPGLSRDEEDRFVCGKCAPVMAHYGRLDWAETLWARAKS